MKDTSPTIHSARETLRQEQAQLVAQIEEANSQLQAIRRALRALEDTPSNRRRRRANKPTGTVREYVEAIRSVLDERPDVTREDLREAVVERITALGCSKVALNVRLSQALKHLELVIPLVCQVEAASIHSKTVQPAATSVLSAEKPNFTSRPLLNPNLLDQTTFDSLLLDSPFAQRECPLAIDGTEPDTAPERVCFDFDCVGLIPDNGQAYPVLRIHRSGPPDASQSPP